MEHIPGYARRDRRVIDYQMYPLAETGLSFRGPRPQDLSTGKYFACLGAAQTFGCFCSLPYPAILRDQLGLEALNLGYGGAGPGFFLKHEALLDYANRARFVILQVMSARSESNSLFDAAGLEFLTRRSDGQRLGADAAYGDLLRSRAAFSVRLGNRELFLFLRLPTDIREVLTETRHNWQTNYLRLLDRIQVPTILFYFSKRKIDYRERLHSVNALLGEFPQLVNAAMIEHLRSHAGHFAECVSQQGSPQPLIDRYTGEPTTVDLSDDRPDFRGIWRKNLYYPSPEMHQDAAAALEPVCRRILAG